MSLREDHPGPIAVLASASSPALASALLSASSAWNLLTLHAVDNQDAARYGITRTLEHAGFTVLEGATGRDCLRLAHLHEPQVIILDVRLPDLDGFEVCRRIKAYPA